MGYRIPEDERVLEAAEAVLAREPVIETQHALAQRVRHQLQVEDPELRVSQRRVRRLVLEAGLAELTIETGTTEREVPERCPACRTELRRLRNRTLDGRETVVGARCPSCPYHTGPRFEVPLRYGFEHAGGMLTDERAKGPF